MFRVLLETLKQQEQRFSDWLPHHFLEAKSETLKHSVESALLQEPYMESFLREGKEAEMNALLVQLREEVPMMTVATLKGILDALHRHEALQETISQDLVKWYRAQGWKFPLFHFESQDQAK